MTSGNLAGFPVVDVTTTLIDGSYHEVDSSALAFQIAARGAFREAMQKCGARLLEPVMKVCTVWMLLPLLFIQCNVWFYFFRFCLLLLLLVSVVCIKVMHHACKA